MSSDPSKDRKSRTGRSGNSIAAHQDSSMHDASTPMVTTNSDCLTASRGSIMSDLSESPDTTTFLERQESIASPSAESWERLRHDVIQKDELIAALVHELEQAVEQLDRFHRTGSSNMRSSSMAANSPSSETVDAQSPVMDDVRRLVEQLEQSQSGTALNRIEAQLAAVYDLISDLHHKGPSYSNEHHHSECDRQHFDADVPESNSPKTSTVDDQNSSWEAVKSKMLSDASSEEAVANRENETEFLRLLSDTPTPKAIDFSVALPDELKAAIAERDAYIIQLNRLFRSRHTFTIPTDWATLASVPADLQVRVETLIDRLDVQVRLGEVEMSLERARLARERSQIQSEREHIEKHLKRLGLSSIADLDNISAATGTASDRRWMRFLGPSNK